MLGKPYLLNPSVSSEFWTLQLKATTTSSTPDYMVQSSQFVNSTSSQIHDLILVISKGLVSIELTKN